jgi:glycosyltransferase involved in cell wall biosynthesis
MGADSAMLVRYKQSTEESVLGINIKGGQGSYEKENYFLSEIQEQYINKNRTDRSNTFFTLPYPGCDLSYHPLVIDADLINLHWIALYQSPVTLQKLFDMGKPVVWTLHDQWPFTGGCHYSAGCNKYSEDCSTCPQLDDDPFNLPAAVLKDKMELFKGANLTIITPSRWLADCARRSTLFKDYRIECIPNSVDTEVFSPISKPAAKASLDITEETITFLFGADNGNEKRKGFRELMAAIQYCLDNAGYRELVENNRIKILCTGFPSNQLKSIGIPSLPLGYLLSDDQMQTAYSAADIFVLPSLEDNLPNTVLEAQSCGTPVIAFNVGGMPDVIVNGVTGMLVPPYNISALGDAICSLAMNPSMREDMGHKCRRMMLEHYSLERQAERYMRLYEELGKPEPSQRKFPQKINDVYNSIDSAVSIETGMGKSCQMIFDKVLLMTLKKSSLHLNQELSTCKADCAAKLGAIQELAALTDRETTHDVQLKQIAELTDKMRVYEEEINCRESYLAKIKVSTSWRLTAPLRYVKTLFMNMRMLSR